MKIGLLGYGKMGKLIEKIAQGMGDTVVDAHSADICLDFSHPDVVFKHLAWAIHHQKSLIIGTTGWEDKIASAQAMVEKSTIAALYASNFSIGVALFTQLLKQAKTLFLDYDMAGIEYHHKEKRDSPSGTSKEIARTLQMRNDFTSVRVGHIVGKHEVIFDSLSDRITLTHEAHNRESFARGAINVAHWICGKKGWFQLDDMLDELFPQHVHSFSKTVHNAFSP